MYSSTILASAGQQKAQLDVQSENTVFELEIKSCTPFKAILNS